MSFDLQEALNGAPVKLNNGRKAFMLYDLRKYPSLLRATGRLPINGIMLGNNEDDGDHVTWDEFGKAENSYLSISGMWEEPKLTSEQVLEKAYQENLPLDAIGKKAFVIAKTKDGDYVMQCGEDNLYFASHETEWEFYKDPAPKSDTITVTLPRPVRPREVGLYWRIVTKNNELCIEKMMCFIGDYRDTPACNYFASEADAKAWLDAMKNALDD